MSLTLLSLPDVRVVQRREDLGFALEASQPLGVVGEQVGQDLERHVAVELGVAGAVDLTHAAGADLGGDGVGTEGGAG